MLKVGQRMNHEELTQEIEQSLNCEIAEMIGTSSKGIFKTSIFMVNNNEETVLVKYVDDTTQITILSVILS